MNALQIAVALALLAGNIFFVAVEFSVTKARPTMVDQLVEEGAGGARSLKHGVDNIDKYLSACQLGITVCSIGLGVTAEPLLTDVFETALPIAATLAFIQFGDRCARDVMVPRGEVDVVRAGDSLRSAARAVGRSAHSRLPVGDAEQGLDAPLGLLTIADLVTALGEDREGNVANLARPLPETAAGTELD
jgi:CBS domain containing-hemolysin-like protein